MVKYENGKIYKLVNDQLNLTYYGSTCNELRKRLYKHKCDAINKICTSYKLFESGVVKIYLVEKFSCNDKMELSKKERFYIENNDCVNKNIPTRTQKEYNYINKDKIKEKTKEYFEKNKERIKEKTKEYFEKNKERIKEKAKEYYQINKERIKERNKEQAKEYYQINKEIIKERNKEQAKEYYQRNKEKTKQQKIEYYKNNRESILARQKEARLKKGLIKNI